MYADGMVQIGTIWWPSLNVFTGLFFACLIVLSAIALLCSPIAKLPEKVKDWIRIISALAMLVFVLLAVDLEDGFQSDGIWPGRRPNADSFAIVYQCVAFGFGISLSCLRSPRLGMQINGGVLSFAFWGLIAWEAACKWARGFFGSFVLPPGAIWVVAFVCLACVPIAFAIAIHFREIHTRRDRGLCERCGYDLRGNTSGQCPECGAGNVQDR